MGANRYGDKIKSIECSHARMRTPHEPLTEGELSILRMELGKLTWIARMARPGLIYDADAAAQEFPNGGINVGKREEETLKEEEEIRKKEEGGKEDFGHMPGCINFQKEKLKGG